MSLATPLMGIWLTALTAGESAVLDPVETGAVGQREVRLDGRWVRSATGVRGAATAPSLSSHIWVAGEAAATQAQALGLACRPTEGGHGVIIDTGAPQAARTWATRLRGLPGITLARPLLGWPIVHKAVPDDPLLADQWHLSNAGAPPDATTGVDIRATTAWGVRTGLGCRIAIVDEGMLLGHPDLAPAIDTTLMRDVADNDANPGPNSTYETHATIVGGLAAARGFNGIGICGAAPQAQLVPVRLLNGFDTTDNQTARAFRVGVGTGSQVDVSNNSWGQADDGAAYGPERGEMPLQELALTDATTAGRLGRGACIVFAAGNGAQEQDDTAYDGFQQFRQVVAVGAIDANGQPTWYTEPGANLLVCAPGGTESHPMVSTNWPSGSGNAFGTGSYTTLSDTSTIGTSFAAPLVSGTIALALSARPDLTWRDVQHLLVRTARSTASSDPGWQTTGSGLAFHHRLGFGLVDAQALVTAAGTWTPVPAEDNVMAAATSVGALADASDTVLSFTVSGGDLRCEAVDLDLTINHARWSDLSFTLVSPAGTRADIGQRTLDTAGGLRRITVICRPFWDELAAGTWTLTAHDAVATRTGSVTAASLHVWGWRPRPAPSLASVSQLRAGNAAQTVTCTGTGFVTDAAGLIPLTTVTWSRGGLSGTATVVGCDSDASMRIQLPAEALNGSISDLVTIALANPAFQGAGGGAATSVDVPLAANRAPTVQATTLSATAGTQATTALVASDADGDPVALSVGTSTLGTLTILSGTLTFAAGTTVGSEQVTLLADDGLGGTATALVTVTVTAAPPPPTSSGSSGGGGCGLGSLAALLALAGLVRRRR